MTNTNQAQCKFAVAKLLLLTTALMMLCGAIPAIAADSPMLHNSNRFSAPSKWGVNGWGIPGGRYEEFNCNTCHAKGTGNIKRIKKDLVSPDTVNGAIFPIQVDAGQVTFLDTRNGTADFGDDTVAGRPGGDMTKSDKICEACHSRTKYHRYDTTNDPDAGGPLTAQVDFDHYNGQDCISCHKHKTGFTASCDNCHYADKQLADSHPVHFNSATVATGNYNTITSTQTEYVFQCGNCHLASGTNHAAGDIDPGVRAAEIAIGGGGSYSPGVKVGTQVGPDGSFDYTDGTCSALYCHSDGDGGPGVLNPRWTVSTMTCTSCHEGASVGTGLSGAHETHIQDGTIMSVKSCETCHAVTTTNGSSIADKRLHVNKAKDVNVAATYNMASSFSFTQGTDTCSSTYCHSDGQGGNNDVSWGNTINDCVSCHDGAVGSTGLSGSHEAHLVAAQNRIGRDLTCNECHQTTASSNIAINDPSAHVDTVKTLNVANFGTSQTGTSAAACATVQCHSDGNYDSTDAPAGPVYKDPSASWAAGGYGCDSCHGSGGNAYPQYGNVPANGDNNSHVEHMSQTGISCENCHEDTSTVGTSIDGADPTAHVNNQVDVVFNSIGGLTGVWNDGTNTCSTTYCHDAGTPQWGGTVNCGDCHKADKTLPASHATHYNSGSIGDRTVATKVNDTSNYVFQCGTCHSETPHADGTKQVVVNSATWGGAAAFAANTCDNLYCHSDGTSTTGPYTVNNPPVWNSSVMTCGSCHEATPTSGKHTPHVADGTIMTDKSCETCHSVTTTDGSSIANTFTHVNQVKDVDVNDTYNSATTGYGSSTCSAVYCHSDGKSNYYDIAWSASITDCQGCHGGAPTGATASTGGAGTSLSASHDAHIGLDATDTSKQFGFTCNVCHEQTASSNAAIGTPANHLNVTVDVAVNSTTFGGTGNIGGDYGAVTAGQCATTLCHGSTTPDWTAGATTTGDCSTCHGMAADPTDGRDTNGNTANTDPQVGAHVVHLSKSIYNIAGNLSCGECHKTTVDNQALATSYVDKVNASGHLDSTGSAEIVFGSLAKTGALSPDYNSTLAGSCSNTYCHDGSKIGNGWSGTLNTPDWDTPYLDGTAANDCAFCHGYPPNPANGHPNDTNCSNCHLNVVASDDAFVNINQHINGIVEYNVNDCTTCHGSGAYKDPNTNHPDHGDHTDVDYFLAGKTVSASDFGKTAASGTNNIGWYDVVYSASGSPVIGCGQCHQASEALHRNGIINTDLAQNLTLTAPNAKRNNTVGANYNTAVADRCSGVYCHSDGENDGTYSDSPRWGIDTITDCKGCHGNVPNTGTHNNHFVGIHYEGLYDDSGSGQMSSADAPATDAGAAHGNTATSSTIACQTCHADTVAVNGNGTMENANMTLNGDAVGASGCSACHTSGGGNPGDGAPGIKPSSTTHLSGAKDVVFEDLSTFKSKAQLRNDITVVTELNDNWTRTNNYKAGDTSFDQAKVATPTYAGGGGSCSNVSCHNGNVTPDWSSGFVGDCTKCHTSLPQ